MTNKIFSREPMIMEDIKKAGEYLETLIKIKRENIFSFNLDEPSKMKEYINKLEDIVDEIKGRVKNWDQEYYVIDIVNCSYNHYTRIYDYDGFSIEKNNKHDLKYSSDENPGYLKFGIYKGLPLYITKTLDEVMDRNKITIKEINHEEIRNSKTENVYCNGNNYENNILRKWFYDGIVFIDSKNNTPVWTIAETGVYDSDWFGCKAHTYRAKEISGPVEFKVK